MLLSFKQCFLGSMTNEKAFTLVELIIALSVSVFVMIAVVTIYLAQTTSFSQLTDVSEIQQDLRGALVILQSEIRQAGCDPLESNVPRVLVATNTDFQFTLDIAGGDPALPNAADGDVDDANENIAFGLGPGADADNDGIIDGADWNNDGVIDHWGAWIGTGSLRRQVGGAGGFQPLADNIEALEFNYVLADGTTSLSPANLKDIRAVQVSLLARATNRAEGFLNTNTYTTASGVVWNPPNDSFHRRLVVVNIQCRNLGY
jgi:type IV pilus assembly protein PilW